MVRAFAHGAMGRWIDSSWWTYLGIFLSSVSSTTGAARVMAAAGFLSRCLNGRLPHVRRI